MALLTAGAGVVGVDVPDDLLTGGEGVTSRALRFAAIVRVERAALWMFSGFNGRGLKLWPWEAVEYLGDTKLDHSRAIGGPFEATAAFIYQGWCHRLGILDK